MLYQVAFVVLSVALIAALTTFSFRHDRKLGWTVIASLVIYILGGIAMGVYLEVVRGRAYLAPDEIALLHEGRKILNGWVSGNAYAPSIPGLYPLWNAVSIAVWGETLVPLRFVNAIVGAAGVAAAFLLAESLFGLTAARVAALGVMLSPSLILAAIVNLKERSLGAMATVAAIAAIAAITKPTIRRATAFLVSVYALGELRHYYAAILAWLTVGAFPFASTLTLTRRLCTWIGLVVATGVVLQILTGTFLALNMRNETVVRYVTPQDSQASSLPSAESSFSLVGETSGRAQPPRSLSDISGLSRSLAFVLFGGFSARAGVGRVLSAWLFGEWMANFLLLPLAIAGTAAALKRGQLSVLIVAGFVGAVILLLAWTHGDDWTTYRFREIYWPLLLVLASGGLIEVVTYWRDRTTISGPIFHRRVVEN